MRSALVAGHLCVDLLPALSTTPTIRPGQLVEVGPLGVHAGGCVANTGGDLAALGAPVQVVGDAGDADLSLTGVDLLHIGYPSLLPALAASGGAALDALLTRARAAGITTSLDLAVLDPVSPATRQDWPALLARVLPLVDLLTPSLDDVRSALQLDVSRTPGDLRRTTQRLLDLGPAVVMLTAGALGLQLGTADTSRLARAGAVFANDPARQTQWSDQERFVTAQRVPVRTTVGAGDAATAGLLYGLLADLDPVASLQLAARTAASRVSGTPIQPVPPG